MELAHPLSVALVVLAVGPSLPARQEAIDLRRSPGRAKILRSCSGRPDKRGVMAQDELLLPSVGRDLPKEKQR